MLSTSPLRLSLTRLLISGFLLNAFSVGAWGELGHRAIGRVAESLLSPTARAEVNRLLGAGDDLASASVWADQVRSGRPESRPWHYITLQVRGPHVSPASADTPNVLTAMQRFEAVLASGSGGAGAHGAEATDFKKAEALKWLAHFVGDAHQPLHAGEDHDRGGNETSVRLGRRKMGWHQAWDHGFLSRLDRDENALVQQLQDTVQAWLKAGRGAEPVTFAEMVSESHALARLAYARNGRPIKGRGRIVELEAHDIAWAQQVTLMQLARGGIRLAHVLNRALDPRFAAERLKAMPKGSQVAKGEKVVAPRYGKPGGTPVQTKPSSDLTYAWSKNSKVYHRLSCPDVAKIAPDNLVKGETPPQARRLHQGCAKNEAP